MLDRRHIGRLIIFFLLSLPHVETLRHKSRFVLFLFFDTVVILRGRVECLRLLLVIGIRDVCGRVIIVGSFLIFHHPWPSQRRFLLLFLLFFLLRIYLEPFIFDVVISFVSYRNVVWILFIR